MDVFVILLGIAIFLAAALVFSIDHFELNPAQAVLAFIFPPFAWWLYRHYWERSQRIVYTQIAAIILVMSAVLVNPYVNEIENKSLFKETPNKKPKNYHSNYVGSTIALNDLAKAEGISQSLNGRLDNQKFIFDDAIDSAQFDELGNLRIKQGRDFFGSFELYIALNVPLPLIDQEWSRIIRARDNNAPVIYLSWYDAENNQMQSKKFTSAYDLDFSLIYDKYNKYKTKIQLVLPDKKNSFLVGSFSSYSSALRFHAEGMIRGHNSFETLEVIATQSLSRVFSDSIKNILGFQNTDYSNGTDEAVSHVYVKDRKGVIRKLYLELYRNEDNWELSIHGIDKQLKSAEQIVTRIPKNLRSAKLIDYDNIGMTLPFSTIVKKNVEGSVQFDSQTEARKKKKFDPTVPRVDRSNEVLKVNTKINQTELVELLLPLMNRDVELVTNKSKYKTGVYVGVYRKQIILETELGGGSVELLTEVFQTKSLRLLKRNDSDLKIIEFYSE